MAEIVLSFGKHRGQKLSEVPQDYLRWLADQPTICGKSDIPQAAKSLLLQNRVVSEKECCYCRRPISGEAVPVHEQYGTNGRVSRSTVKYMHPLCARRASED